MSQSAAPDWDNNILYVSHASQTFVLGQQQSFTTLTTAAVGLG